MSTDTDPPASEDKDSTPTATAVDNGTVNGVVASESGDASTELQVQSRVMSVEVVDQSEGGALGSGSATQEGDQQPTPSEEQVLETKQIQETPQTVVAPDRTPVDVEAESSAPSDPTPAVETEKEDENAPPTAPDSKDVPFENLLNGDGNNHAEKPANPMESSNVADGAEPEDTPAAKEEAPPESETKESEITESANRTNDLSEEPTPTTMETSEETLEAEQPKGSVMATDPPATSDEPEKVVAGKETPSNSVPSTEDPATENVTEDVSEAPKQPPEDPPSSSNETPPEKPDAPMDPPTASDELKEPAVAVDTPMQASECAETEIETEIEIDGSNKRALEEPPASADATNPESESVEPPAKQPKLETEAPLGSTSTTSVMDVEANDKDAPVTEDSAETPQAQDPPTTNAETNVELSEGMDVDEPANVVVAPVEETQPTEKAEDTPGTGDAKATTPAEAVDQVDTVEPKTQPLEVKENSQNGVSAESTTEDTTPVSEMDVDATTGGPLEPAVAEAEKPADSSEVAPLELGDVVAGEDKPPLQTDLEALVSEKPSAMQDTNGGEVPVPASDEVKEPALENGGASGDKTSKKGRKNNMDPRVLELRRNIQLGCRDNDLASAIQYYDQAVKEGITVEVQSFYNLLNLCGGIERKVHVGKRKEDDTESADTKFLPLDAVDPKTRQEHAFRVKEHMAQLNIPLNEAAYTAIVKVLVANKDYEKAEKILRESEAVQQCRPKLRLYAPLLTAYCSERQMLSALRCWLTISKQELQISERESMFLLRCAVATGDPVVFERVFSNLAEDVTVPCKDTVAAVLEWFASAHAMHTGINHPNRARDEEVRKLVEEIHEKESDIAPSIGPVVHKFGWNLDSSVSIDENGVLQEGGLKGVKLNPVQIPESAWETMIDMNRRIVLEGKLEGHMSEFQGGRKGKIRDDFDPEERRRQWAHFENFLEHVGPLDVVIDAANVGYMNQSFSNAPKHVNYEQIDWVARRFQKMRKRVLLVLHQRHFAKNLMPPKYRYLQDAWERMDILYKTPAGMNDDWFWLHAALKYRTLVLTNDEMRDHHFQMLSPRTFLRWKERHQVHFDFGDWETQGNEFDNDSRTRKVELQFPTPYSRRIQRVQDSFVIPLIKKGDENRFLDGYHVADHDEPEEETYLCICPLKEGESAAPDPMAAINNTAAPS